MLLKHITFVTLYINTVHAYLALYTTLIFIVIKVLIFKLEHKFNMKTKSKYQLEVQALK